ncbi:FCD domain-containing protein [Salinisphaera sp. SPP-AMP-43]|uniref:GntR family transcriptional regulator n=1 Tax=Salinisphaera sp. SPP-AMP-43 TaxID=3121288 RepID=UPI003C6DFE8D
MTDESRWNLYHSLRRDLIDGRFEAGQKLAIGALKERYGVGLSPLREALNRLAATGLLDQSHQRGFRVPELSHDSLDDVANLRRELEGQALAQAIEQGDQEWEVSLVAALHRLKQAEPMFDSSAHDQWEQRHSDFHRALIAGCGSRWRLRFIEQLHDQFDRYRRSAPKIERRREKLDDQHAKLAEYALARDSESACALLDEHIRLSWRVAITSLPEAE